MSHRSRYRIQGRRTGYSTPRTIPGGRGVQPRETERRTRGQRSRPRLQAVGGPEEVRKTFETALFEVKRVIVGQETMLERVFVALLADGHILLEGVPGLAKTMTIKAVSDVLGGSFKRIQFTPDLVPSDLVGTRIYRADSGRFDTELGPVFCNFLLADEINRAPAKVQSALLEVMQERQVTIGPADLPVAAPVPGAGDAEPDRVRGHLPAAGGTGRPLHVQGRDRLPLATRGGRGRGPLARAAARGREGAVARAAGRGPARDRGGLRGPCRERVRGRAGAARRAAPRHTASARSRRTSSTAPARAARST